VAILRDMQASDEVLQSATRQLGGAQEDYRANFNAIYRAFPHEKQAFSKALPESAGRESLLMKDNWDVFERKFATLNEAESINLVSNTKPAWSENSDLKSRVGTALWNKVRPVDQGVIAMTHGAKKMERHGFSASDLQADQES
jgi:hypothetical protein